MPAPPLPSQPPAGNLWVAVLGRRDEPTDALDDYCYWLGAALGERGVECGAVRVRWDEIGWLHALADLWRRGDDWRGRWALAQYTALMWSRRGIPFLFLLAVGVLRIRGVRVALVFHDPQPYGGKRLVDRLRRACQLFVMRWAYRMSHATVLTVPVEKVSWLPGRGRKATFIPVGANLPAVSALPRSARNGHEPKTIAVFAITDAGDITREVGDIVRAAKRAAESGLQVRLVTLGRGSAESDGRFRQALDGSNVQFSSLGVLPADKVAQILANADVALFVRGPITTQRGSAIASIASAVPLVTYADPDLPAPLAEAGIVGVLHLDGEKLAEAAVRVLTDPQLWRDLHERSRHAYRKYFSWGSVASRFIEVLPDA